jgi:hypothetical protein
MSHQARTQARGIPPISPWTPHSLEDGRRQTTPPGPQPRRPIHGRNIPTTRHLLLHVYPAEDDGGLWQRHIMRIGQAEHLFTGRRLVAVAIDRNKTWPFRHAAAFIRNHLGQGAIITPFQNCPQLREVATFRPLLELIAGTHADDEYSATFYAHTKANATAENAEAARKWAAAMYDHLLTIEATRHLADFAAVGTTKIKWPPHAASPYPSHLDRGGWMFAGTMFWFRHDAIFTHPDWRDIAHDRYGAEAWLSTIIDPEAGLTTFQPWPETQWPAPSPYQTHHYGTADLPPVPITYAKAHA